MIDSAPYPPPAIHRNTNGDFRGKSESSGEVTDCMSLKLPLFLPDSHSAKNKRESYA